MNRKSKKIIATEKMTDMKKEILIVTVVDLITGKKYSDSVPYNKHVGKEQINTLKKDLINNNNLSKENCRTEWKIETE